MILKNFWAWYRYVMWGSTNNITIPADTLIDDTGNNIVTLYGQYWNARFLIAFNPNQGSTVPLTDYTWLVFGTGTTSPQYSDYSLEADCTSSFSVIGNITSNIEDAKINFTFNWQLTNNTNSDISITEIGVKKKVSPSNGTTKNVLLLRQLLDEPFTIAAGATKVFNYTWTMQ